MRRLEKINRGGRQGIVGKQPLRNILESLPKDYILAYYKNLMARRKKARRKTGMKIPHPSVTGMAAGFNLASWLNDSHGGYAGSVIDSIQEGEYKQALIRFSNNSQSLIKWNSGKKVLAESVVIGGGGALIRKWLNNPKLGGNRIFLRV